jgi:spore coat protein U-like protein
MLSSRLLRCSAVALACFSSLALAAVSPIQSTGKATAAVANTCVIVSADNLSFGTYSPINGLAAVTTGQVNLTCTKGAAFTVAPTSGGAALHGAGGSLAYGLYIDSAMTQTWGMANPTRLVDLDLNKTAQSPLPAGWIPMVFQTKLTAAQFSANTSYAQQPYMVTNEGGAPVYYINYVGQYQTNAQGNALRDQYPNSTAAALTSTSNIRITTVPVTTAPAANTLVLPPSTAKTGSVYQIPTGFSGLASLSGTAASAHATSKVTYYGKIPAGQDMVPGSYIDTVVFTVSF